MQDFKVEKGNFTTTQNDIFRYTNNGVKLTPEAWGVYVFMLSLPEDWDFTIRGLEKVVNAGKNKIQRILKELVDAGFINRTQTHDGRFGKMQYTILQSPNKTKKTIAKESDTITEIQCPQNQRTEIQYPQNPPQLNTKELNTKELSLLNIDKLDKQQGVENNPSSNTHYLTSQLIKKRVIDILHADVDKFNTLFTELDARYDYELVLRATRYLIKEIKNRHKDIDSIYAYFKSAIIHNLDILSASYENIDYSKLSMKDMIKNLSDKGARL